ncbi:MAG TPA: hypothetical protein VFS43_36595 [Polyangiaceae bacterium]|nr:hypothetical protein [Polyangiaceae bacterium]
MNAYRGGSWFLFFALGAAAALSAPGEARACSLPQPPKGFAASASFVNGSSYPSNAVIFFSGLFPGEAGVEGVEVTVDGFPARLVPTEGERFGEVSEAYLTTDRAFRVSPEPRPGQRVVIRGVDCGADEGFGPSGECPEVEFKYTATAPDEAPPAAPVVTYDVQEYSSLSASCDRETELRVFAHLSTPLEGGAGAPSEYVVEGFADEALTERVFVSRVGAGRPSYDVALTETVKCVRVWAFDYAGNEVQPSAPECALPAWPAPEPKVPAERPVASAEPGGCHVSAAAAARPAPWAALLAASALLLGGRRRRAPAR